MAQPSHRRSLAGRPYRRLVRWVRHTPGQELAQTMIALGITLVVAAVVLAVAIA